MKIFISSNAIDNDINKVLSFGHKNKLKIEFSSNIKYSKNNIEIFKSYKYSKLTHNYFPASKIPFVFNLASEDQFVRDESLNLCKINIDLAADLDLPIFSCHAGFAFDASAKQLGKKFDFKKRNFINYYNNFESKLDEILNYAISKNVTLLIENNVTIMSNYIDNYSPLFCSSINDILLLSKKFYCDNFGILFDTAHHKVSSYTFGNEIEDGLDELYPYIKGIHHSDNNSLKDTNDTINQNYWWFNKKRNILNCCYHVLETRRVETSILKNQINLLKNNYDSNL